jgi:integrase
MSRASAFIRIATIDVRFANCHHESFV